MIAHPGAGGGRFDAREPGRLRAARWVCSPNQDERPADTAIDTIVIHFISLPPGKHGTEAIEALFCNRLDAQAHPSFAELASVRVSSHLLIDRRGRLMQFVSCERRAWHAGASALAGRERFNDFSIGIELEGDEFRQFTRRQYARLESTIAALRTRYRLRWIVGHADIAPGRKIDPGPRFDWPDVLAMPACRGLSRPLDHSCAQRSR